MSGATSSTSFGATSLQAENINPPRLLWLYFPPVMILVSLTLRIANPDFYFAYMEGELGVVENATVILMMPALYFILRAVFIAKNFQNRLLTSWLILNALGCFYFMGEEASWGQHWFGWANEGIFENHPRGETNLHNTSHWFDQKPKVLVEIWTIVGAIIVPIWFWRKGQTSANKSTIWYWLWPTYVCLPTAVVCSIVKNIERIRQDWKADFPAPFDIRFSEPQEYYFALFFLIYMFSIYLRVKQEERLRQEG